MRTIWKYELKLADRTDLELPKDSRVLHVDTQEKRIYIWVLAKSDYTLEMRRFRLIGTGCSIDEGLRYIGTVYIDCFVWHVFEDYL